MLHYLVAASVGYLQNYCYGIGTRVAFEPPKETSSRSFTQPPFSFPRKELEHILPATRISSAPDIVKRLHESGSVTENLIPLFNLGSTYYRVD